MKNSLSSIVFAIAIIVASVVIGHAYLNRSKTKGTISTTGLGQADFTSDLIVWEATFSEENFFLQQAYADLEKDKKTILKYLISKGIEQKQIIFNAVRTNKKTRNNYNDKGDYIGADFIAYSLSQTVQITSKNVEKVEKVSREITELLNKGVSLYSNQPRYYYTKLDDLKIEMISRATENARIRAENIASNSGANLGELISARMGIFQITGQNSNEDYSWGGAYNTSSKEKNASITMKLTYRIK